jgi:hypothetical protein
VSTTPANNPCHGFSVIAGVVDTGDKFLTGEQLSPVTTTKAINLSQVTMTPVNNYPVDNDTGDKFIACDKNMDAMEVGSCQG